MASVHANTVSVMNLLCVILLVCALLLKCVDTHSQRNWVPDKFEAEDSGTSVKQSTLEDAGKERLKTTDHDEEPTLEKSDSKDEGGFVEEEDDKVEFIAVISQQRHDNQQGPCRRHHHGLVKFDTITPTSHLFSLRTSTFTIPYNGMYIFSVKFQFRQPQGNELNDVSILTDDGQTVCSISPQNGDASGNRARFESSAMNSDENVNHRDDLSSAQWSFDAGTNRINSEWFEAPTSAWNKNLRTKDVEGFCEGLKHLRQGQRVFVSFGELKDGDRGDNVDATVDGNVDETVEFCDHVSAFFSGSLLAKDLEY